MGTCNASNSKQGPKSSLAISPQNGSDPSEAKRRLSTKSSIANMKRGSFVQENSGLIMKSYKIFPTVIGKGAKSEVRKAVHQISGEFRTIKIVRIDSEDPDSQKEVLAELEIRKALDHPYIIKVYEYFIAQNSFYLVMDFIDGRPLFDYIVDKAIPLSEKLIATVFSQLMTAVNYVHGLGLLHRNIKSNNVLYNGKHIVLVDFGMSKSVSKRGSVKDKIVGTDQYVAPEIITSGIYSEKSDVWACGVILYMLASGHAPFLGDAQIEVFENVRQLKFIIVPKAIPKISEGLRDLLCHMLEPKYKERFNAEQCLQHPFLQDVQPDENPEAFKEATLRLKSKVCSGQMQEALYAYFVGVVMPKAEQEQLAEIFNSMDKNKDGVLSKEELKLALEKAGKIYSHEEIDDIFEKVDIDKNGTISFYEFLLATFNKEKAFNEERLLRLFKTLGGVC